MKRKRTGIAPFGVVPALLVWAVTGACDSSAPCVVPEGLVTSNRHFDGFQIVDPRHECGAINIPAGGRIESAAISPDGGLLYAGIVGADNGRDLIAVSTSTGSIKWRRSVSVSGQPVDVNGPLTTEALAVSPDNRLLYVWRGFRAGVQTIVAVNASTGSIVAHAGPWTVSGAGLVPLPASPRYPNGALVVVGSPDPVSAAGVYVLDPGSLQLIDSISPGTLGGMTDIWQASPSDDSTALFVSNATSIVRYDITAGQTVAAAQRPSNGPVSVLPANEGVVVGDVGTWPDSPGAGLLWFFDADLNPTGTLDVSSPFGGVPGTSTAVVSGSAVASASGATLYVASGSPAGSLYPGQAQRVIVVSLPARLVANTIPIGGDGLPMIFAAKLAP